MDLIRRAGKIGPSTKQEQLPSTETNDKKDKKKRPIATGLAFFRRPLRLRGSSSLSVPLGVVLVFPLLVVILILVLFVSHPGSGGLSLIPGGAAYKTRKISERYDKIFQVGCAEPDTSKPRANAAFVVLARNKELEGVIQSIRSVERHFNRWFHYPYVFLNDGEFDDVFKETVRNHTSSKVEFGMVKSDMWGFPDWIDHNVAKEGIAKQGDAAVMYGGMESYHLMCRFYSGFVFTISVVKQTLPFRIADLRQMIEHNKTYGFTIAVKELAETVPNIFRYASAFKRLNNIKSQGLWEMFIDPEGPQDKKLRDLPLGMSMNDPLKNTPPAIDMEAMEGEIYNMCHFWSNFEIANLNWFRSKEYMDFFEMMDRSGGFWMERWGDAPIHSLAAGILLGPKDIHYFRDIGYRHTTIQHCPANAPNLQLPRPAYLEETIPNPRKRRREDEYWEDWDDEKENGSGCRCKCDTDVVEVEGKEGSCMAEWVDVAGGWANA